MGLWSLKTGKRIEHADLFGPVVHMVYQDGRLFMATELADHLVWDLRAFEQPYCQLLSEIWSEVPVTWDKGNAQARPLPALHACL